MALFARRGGPNSRASCRSFPSRLACNCACPVSPNGGVMAGSPTRPPSEAVDLGGEEQVSKEIAATAPVRSMLARMNCSHAPRLRSRRRPAAPCSAGAARATRCTARSITPVSGTIARPQYVQVSSKRPGRRWALTRSVPRTLGRRGQGSDHRFPAAEHQLHHVRRLPRLGLHTQGKRRPLGTGGRWARDDWDDVSERQSSVASIKADLGS